MSFRRSMIGYSIEVGIILSCCDLTTSTTYTVFVKATFSFSYCEIFIKLKKIKKINGHGSQAV